MMLTTPITKIWKVFLLAGLVQITSQSPKEFPGPTRPFFSPPLEDLVKAQVDEVAYLSCEVFNRNNLSVSWVRIKDSHIISVDSETFISDDRFSVVEKKEKMFDRLSLVIHRVVTEDAGRYDCQVSSQPKISKFVELVVLQPKVNIEGDSDIHVKEGSRVVIKCVIRNTVQPVPFVTWLFEGQVRNQGLSYYNNDTKK